MKKPAEIRLAVDSDRDSIVAIAEAAYALYLSRMDKKPAPMTEDYAGRIAEQRVHVLESKEETAAAAEGSRIAGFLVLVPEEEAMLLDNVAVSPAAPGRGFGNMLLVFAEDKARQAGYGKIYLYTNEVMTENLGLYTHLGYAETHRASDKGFNRVYMAKELQ